MCIWLDNSRKNIHTSNDIVNCRCQGAVITISGTDSSLMFFFSFPASLCVIVVNNRGTIKKNYTNTINTCKGRFEES